MSGYNKEAGGNDSAIRAGTAVAFPENHSEETGTRAEGNAGRAGTFPENHSEEAGTRAGGNAGRAGAFPENHSEETGIRAEGNAARSAAAGSIAAAARDYPDMPGWTEPLTFAGAVHAAEQYLSACGILDAAVDAWYLFEFVTGMSRASYLAELRMPFPEKWKRPYSQLLRARGSHIPLQYLTGEQEFMGLVFMVTPDVLIPRQDTETLVETALARMEAGLAAQLHPGGNYKPGKSMGCEEGHAKDAQRFGVEQAVYAPEEEAGNYPYRILDLCTGSGCIAISLAKLGKTADAASELVCVRGKDATSGQAGGNRPVQIWASDISAAALAVAAENAARLGADVTFVESDLFEQFDPARPFDLIVSNPPYVTEKEMETLDEEVRLYEPRTALSGGGDGLDFYRKIIRESRNFLRRRGCLMFEIGCEQAEAVTGLMTENGFCEVQVRKDLAGRNRVVTGIAG